MNQHIPLFFILYDGIDNSVFSSQVLDPLLQKIHAHPEQKIYLVSFERNPDVALAFTKKIPSHANFEIIILKKIIYIGWINIWHGSRQLKKILSHLPAYDLIARGPFAGMICKRAINNKCRSLVIQARGLLAEEYAYTQAHLPANKKLPKTLIQLRSWQFEQIEKKAFTNPAQDVPIIFQAVSNALKEYLITKYNIERDRITVALEDIPKTITTDTLKKWKTATRDQLGIDDDTHVYCYSGSLKSWQCPEKIIHFFTNQLHENPNSFLLILTQDVSAFDTLMAASSINPHSYKVMNISYDDMYRYLAACNVGLVFRKPHIVNWVSRPTKALEYQAAGLRVMHNDTVEWLTSNISQHQGNQTIERKLLLN